MKKVVVKGTSRICNYKFVEELFEAFKEGYRLSPRESLKNYDIPVLNFGSRVVNLYTEEEITMKDVLVQETPETSEVSENVENVDTSLIEVLEPLSKKADLVEFANNNNIVIPDDVTASKAIKEYLKSKIE